MTTDTQDLIAWLRTDHAFDSTTKGNEAADKLEALQAEVAQKDQTLASANAVLAAAKIALDQTVQQRDAALSRLAELEKQEQVKQSQRHGPSATKSLLMPATAARITDGKTQPVDMSRLPKGAA